MRWKCRKFESLAKIEIKIIMALIGNYVLPLKLTSVLFILIWICQRWILTDLAY